MPFSRVLFHKDFFKDLNILYHQNQARYAALKCCAKLRRAFLRIGMNHRHADLNYHTRLVAPFCLSAVKSFSDGFQRSR